ncbi:MAG: MutS-related protein [Mucilaginibacter sp.]
MNITENYRQEISAAQQQVSKYKKLANTYSFLRLGVFALIVGAIWIGKANDNFTFIVIAFVMLLFAFLWLVQKQSGFEKERKYFENLVLVIENEINSILTNTNLYSNGQQFEDEKHFYTSDLDIFGRASLFQLINRAATPTGNSKLADWVGKASTKDDILSRQQAVAELAAMSGWKHDVQANLLFAKSEDKSGMDRLFAYLQLQLKLPGEKLLLAYIRIAPYLLLALVIGGYFFSPLYYVAGGVAFANWIILNTKMKLMLQSGMVAGKISGLLSNYVVVFESIEKTEWKSARCRALADKLRQEQTSKNIKELSKLINNLDAGMIMIVGFVLNIVFLWSLKYILLIEKWKQNSRQNIQEAFTVVAEFEALISLASLKINYPEWSFPQIADGGDYTLSAKKIGHPLIQSVNRVDNDFDLENARHIDIITGSNMAGKSTFLRTIGINTVLALCGAPVCASEMKVSVMTIISYMRIKDSLNESTSTFKAELDRLQMLLAAVETEPNVFFLIDEMLRGTNSVDKYLGSKAVIEKLIGKKGAGMVATHDLQIAELEKKYPDYIRNFYFDIQVLNGEMLFDYKIKHGECKTFNASMLLKRIGIDVEAE